MKRIRKRTIRRSLKTLIAALLITCICLQENFVAYASTGAEVTGILNTQETTEDAATDSNGDTTADATQDATETATPGILYEIEEKRDEYTKHFKLSDGTTMAVSYQEKVHYLEDGQYKEINATLTEGTEDGEAVLGNDLGDIAVKYAKKSNKNKLLTIGKGDSKIKIALEGANKVDIEQLTGGGDGTTTTTTDSALDPRLIVKNKANVIYKDILKNTDVAYISTGDYLKENIILKTADVPQSFTFSYKGSHLAYRTADNGETVLYSTKDEQNTLYRINAPFMTDATGNYSNAVTMDISEKGNTIYVTLTPDKEFLKTATYPVIIDPPIETDKEYRGVLDTFVNEVYPNDSAIEGNGSFLVGRNHAYERCRGYIKFENLPKLSAGDVIIKGYFSIYQFKFSAEGAQSFIISAYENTGNWNETVTWNTKPGYGEKVDHVTVGPITSQGTTVNAQQKLLDITRLARKWYSGQNYGLMLMSEEELSRYAVARFFASDYPFNKDEDHYKGSSDLYPSGIFIYRNTNGLENYWSYHSAGDGLATTGYVNDATGALTLTHTDFSESGNVMPLTLVRTYNSNTTGMEAARGLKSGKGWQLNINQYIYHTTLDGKEYYAYVDGDGTTHYISKNSEDKWVDEDGLGLELIISGTEYTIKDASDSKAHFKDVSGKIYLYKLTDVYGNSIT
ncbi:MAG: hypothetical protein IJB96_01495, partial [Lachnospira sp.]|nr:hypothetical protein [Lachnospira sp.]